MTEHSRTALKWGLLGLAVHLAVVGLYLWKYDGNPQVFVHFGERSSVLGLAREVFGPDLLVPHSDGQDGQAFWVLARDPLLLDGREVIVPNIDRPAYRAQRIAYPALASPWRLGGEQALVWGLLVTNLLVVLAGGAAAALLALELGAPARASLAFSLSPGIVLTTVLDVADGLALAALLATLLALRRQRWGLAAAVATLAVLAKEATFLGLLGVAAFETSLPARARLRLLVVPAAAAISWALYARWRLGWPGADVEEFVVPFFGYLDALRRGWIPVGNWLDAVVAFGLLPLGACVLVRLRQRPSILLRAAVPFVLVVPFLSAQVLNLMFNTLRIFAPLVTLLWMDFYTPAPTSPERRPASAR
ncbi:MAG: hypothetical protein ABR538_09935 [Candidatus Binatia bacterium]